MKGLPFRRSFVLYCALSVWRIVGLRFLIGMVYLIWTPILGKDVNMKKNMIGLYSILCFLVTVLISCSGDSSSTQIEYIGDVIDVDSSFSDDKNLIENTSSSSLNEIPSQEIVESSSSRAEKEFESPACEEVKLEDEFCFNDGTGDKVYKISDYCGKSAEYPLTEFFCIEEVPYSKDEFAYCADEIYNVAKSFCFEDIIFDFCENKKYVPSEQFCFEKSLYDLCDNQNFNPATEFCVNKTVEKLCDGQTFDPSIQFCYEKTLVDLCGNMKYNLNVEFCLDDEKYAKCNGAIYDPHKESCSDDGVYPNCGTSLYNPEIQFCNNDLVYFKCNSESYDPSKEFCDNGQRLELCGMTSYDSETQFCSNGVVVQKCGLVVYNPSGEFCSNSKVYTKCGSAVYDPALQFCSSGTLYNLCGGKSYNPSSQGCSNGSVYTKGTCGSTVYNTSTHFCDTRDKQLYKVVKIGTQTWMARNLNYNVSGSYCNSCGTYGRLYNWETAKTACPSGWHLPSRAEWTTLYNYVDANNGSEGVGTSLKSKSGWGTSGNGTDKFGFNGLPAGGRMSSGGYYHLGTNAGFFSTTKNGTKVYARGLNNTYGSFGEYDEYTSYYISVRCLK